MKVGLFMPYGRNHAERNLISVLGLYLNTFDLDVSMITCDGQLSCCNRDREKNWVKNLKTCSECVGQSNQLASLLKFSQNSLANYIKSEDENYIRSLVNDFSLRLGQPLNLGKTNLDLLMLGTLLDRFGTTELDFNDETHKKFYQSIVHNTLRALISSAKLNNDQKYDLVFLAGGQDYLTASVRQSLIETGSQVVIFRYDQNASLTHIIHHRKSQLISVDLNISSVRDYLCSPKNWNQKVTSGMSSIVDFLEINANQMRLPLAK